MLENQLLHMILIFFVIYLVGGKCNIALEISYYFYFINQINKMSNKINNIMTKKIIVFQAKLGILLFFSLVSFCLVGLFIEDLIILVPGFLLLSIVSWLLVKTQIINRTIRTVQEFRTSEEELKSLAMTQQKFFDLMSHDLKSPFNGIEGFVTLLLDETEDFT